MAASLRGEDRAPTTARRGWPTVVGGIVIVLLVLASLALWRQLDSAEDDIGDLQTRLDQSNRTVETLQAQTQRLELGSFDPAVVAKGVRPSVFAIQAPAGRKTFEGTAFAMAENGRRSLLVTNFHVVEAGWNSGVREVLISRGFRRYDATIAKVRPAEDLALLEADAELPLLRPASSPPELGDPVLVIGSAEGLEGTLTTGVVSAVGRRIEGQKWLQFSAPVNPGNSGGPVVDRRGEVVGVATFKAVGVELEGLSFAIPLDRLCASLGTCEYE